MSGANVPGGLVCLRRPAWGPCLVLIVGTNFFFLFFKGGYGGRIINIASVAGIMLMEPLTIEHSSYTVAKHGVVALTRSFVPAAFPKRSVHVQISKFYPDFIKQLIKGFGFISLLHTHKETIKCLGRFS